MKNLLKNFTERFRHLFARTGERVSLSPLMASILTRREQQNDLPWLTPERAVELYEAYRAGNYAEIQLVWDQLEDYDETLFTVLAKRQRTLAAMPWQVAIDAAAVGDDPAKQQLAEAQQEFLNKALLAVENLEEALVHLGMADFRGVAALEITGNATRQRWEVIEPWNLARPSRRGPWLYNEKADPCYTSLETLDATRCIIREERPIDLPVMFLIVDKMHAIKGWDTFLDVFGSPSIFLELPPATSEQKALEFDRRVQQIVSDGRGTIPNGSKFQTVETHADNSQSFEARAKWCREAIITIATGGLLTVEAQSGSGTLAGNAHADSFSELVSGTAAAISNVVNVQWARPLLQKAFPGQRIYAYFSLAAEPADDRAEQAQLIATLAGAGYKAAAEAVSEMAGFEVREVEQPPMMPGGMMTNRAPLPAPQEVPPLTEDELAAFASLATPNLDRMAQRQQEVEAALRAAADLPEDTAEPVENSEGKVHESGTPCKASERECPLDIESEDKEPWEKRQEEREHLEELMAELDRQEEAARDAEASGDPVHYNEEAARDRWSALSREGDPQTREDIEKRLAELDAEDAAEDKRGNKDSAEGFSAEEIQKMGGIPQYNLVPRGKAGREQAENSLHEAANKPLTNTNFEINATISNESIGKLTSGNALGETFRALHDSGFCDKDTAYQIHMTAASKLPELFTKAPKKEEQEVYHDGEHRESATHLFCPFRTEGIDKPVTAEISVIAFKGDDNKRIYSLGMRVRPPLPSSGISQ